MTTEKTGRIEFLRAKHTEHLRINDYLYREDELSGMSAIMGLNTAYFFYAVEDSEWGGETVYVYYGVFYDIDGTFNIDLTSMRIHTVLSVAYDAFDEEKLQSAIDTLIADDNEYRLKRDEISD